MPRVGSPYGELPRFNSGVARSPGDVEVVGNRVGVVVGTKPVAVGDDYTLKTAGVMLEMPAKSSDEWSDGALLYWDDTADELTDTAGSNKTAGLAVGAKTNGQTTAGVDINASVASATP